MQGIDDTALASNKNIYIQMLFILQNFNKTVGADLKGLSNEIKKFVEWNKTT